MRVLKNLARVAVEKNVLGKVYRIKPKGSLTITDQQADLIATDLLQTYGFLKDITPVTTYEAPKAEEVKKVVKPATPKAARRGRRSRGV